MFALTSTTTEETIGFGVALAQVLREDDVVLLCGDLGAGKTQFSKGVAAGLGVAEEVTSPTFNIVLEYVGDELPLLHFDLYRLSDADELDDIGFFELLESGCASLVEWGDTFIDAMPDERLDVRMRVLASGARSIEVTGLGARGEQLECEFAASLAS